MFPVIELLFLYKLLIGVELIFLVFWGIAYLVYRKWLANILFFVVLAVLIVTSVLYGRMRSKIIRDIIGTYSLERFDCEYVKGYKVVLMDNMQYQVIHEDSVILIAQWYIEYEPDAGLYFPALDFVSPHVISPFEKHIEHILRKDNCR